MDEKYPLFSTPVSVDKLENYNIRFRNGTHRPMYMLLYVEETDESIRPNL